MSAQINIESQTLQNALRIVSRLAPPLSGAVNLEVKDNKLWAQSGSDTARCSVVLPSKVKGKAFFALGVEQLGAAIKGRSDLECEYKNSLFKLKSGSYTTDLTTVDAIPVEEEEDDNGGKTWKVSAEQATWLKSAVASVALKPTALMTAYMPVTIKLTSKAAFVACYDEYHMAFAHDKEVTGDLEVTLPLDTLVAVLDTVHTGAFKMRVGKATLTVANSILKVVLSLPEQEDSMRSADLVISKSKEAVKADGTEVQMARDDVLTFLDNAKAVTTKERSEIKVSVTKGKVKFAISTTNGNSKSVIKAQAKKDQEFKVDLEYFEEAIRKCGPEIVMKIVGSAFLTFKTKTTYVLVSLNQE